MKVCTCKHSNPGATQMCVLVCQAVVGLLWYGDEIHIVQLEGEVGGHCLEKETSLTNYIYKSLDLLSIIFSFQTGL